MAGTVDNKGCLYIPELVLRGTVTDDKGKMVALVSNSRFPGPGGHVQFLREEDQLFNGVVDRINSKAVTFCVHELNDQKDQAAYQVTVPMTAPLSPAVPKDQLGQTSGGSSAPGPAVKSFTCSNPTRYTGERFDFHLADIDIVDFFRMIHRETGLNILVNSSVKGAVTMEATGIRWDEALAMAIRNNGLECELQGNVLRIGSLETLRNEAARRTLGDFKQDGCLPEKSNASPVNMDLAAAQIKELLKFIGEMGKELHLKVVVDPSVTGTVTLDFNDQPWDRVLNLVVKDQELQCKLEADTLHITTPRK